MLVVSDLILKIQFICFHVIFSIYSYNKSVFVCCVCLCKRNEEKEKQ